MSGCDGLSSGRVSTSGMWVTDGIDNQTGCFPVTSTKDNKYILLVYGYDSDAILTEPIKNRTATAILRAYTKNNSKSYLYPAMGYLIFILLRVT